MNCQSYKTGVFFFSNLALHIHMSTRKNTYTKKFACNDKRSLRKVIEAHELCFIIQIS